MANFGTENCSCLPDTYFEFPHCLDLSCWFEELFFVCLFVLHTSCFTCYEFLAKGYLPAKDYSSLTAGLFFWAIKWACSDFFVSSVMQTSSVTALWNSPVHAQWWVSRCEKRKAVLEIQTVVVNLMLNWQMHNWAKCICSVPLSYPNCDVKIKIINVKKCQQIKIKKVKIKLTLYSLSSQMMYNKYFLHQTFRWPFFGAPKNTSCALLCLSYLWKGD